jgi:putative transcriptional regulator
MPKIEDLIDPYKRTNMKPASGRLLIAAPFLSDPNFARTVVFLCEHNAEGSVGFVLNRPTSASINDVILEVSTDRYNVYEGGPVSMDTLHVLHRQPGNLGGKSIGKGIFWGASFEVLKTEINEQGIAPANIKLFAGYSGWDSGQLTDEIKEGTWLVAPGIPGIIFEDDYKNIWGKAIRSLGNNYAYLANIPLHPQMN